jgi:septation ring formation regulator EzrA
MFETSTALQTAEEEMHPWQPAAHRSEVASATVTIDFTSREFLASGRLAAPRTLEHEAHYQQAVADPTQDEFVDEEFIDEEEEELTLTMTVTDFAALEDRVARVVEAVKQERQALTAAEERASQAEAELSQQAPRIAELQSELDALKSERLQARKQLNALLNELESLEF